MSAPNEQQAGFWQERAPDWLEAETHFEVIGAAFGLAAMEPLGLGAGRRVLDIGCGSGGTTRELARRVGPRGAALGVDIAPAMIDAARERAAVEGLTHAMFAVADAQVDGFGTEPFDAVFSRFGVMFFADPVAAFANLRRALRPGGNLAFVCWTDAPANEWRNLPEAALAAVTGELPPVRGPEEPGPFAFAEAARVESILGAGGFSDIAVAPRSETIVIPEAGIDAFTRLSRGVGPVREALLTADPATAARIHDAVRAALFAAVTGGELRLNATAFIVTARA